MSNSQTSKNEEKWLNVMHKIAHYARENGILPKEIEKIFTAGINVYSSIKRDHAAATSPQP